MDHLRIVRWTLKRAPNSVCASNASGEVAWGPLDEDYAEQGDTSGFTRLAGALGLTVARCDLPSSVEESVLVVRDRAGEQTSYTVRDVRPRGDGLEKVLVLVPSS